MIIYLRPVQAIIINETSADVVDLQSKKEVDWLKARQATLTLKTRLKHSITDYYPGKCRCIVIREGNRRDKIPEHSELNDGERVITHLMSEISNQY